MAIWNVLERESQEQFRHMQYASLPRPVSPEQAKQESKTMLMDSWGKKMYKNDNQA